MGARTFTGRNLLAANVRRRRLALKLSQEKLAEEAGFHRTYLSQVERAKRNIGIDGVERIAKALRVSIADLFA